MNSTDPVPEINGINAPHWLGLRERKLRYQACTCGNSWLPPRLLCPRCLEESNWNWREASGQGWIVSWVVYHVAYHPAFKDRLPYNVAIVELEEGPRLITNILDANDRLSVGARVRLVIDTAQETPLAQFQLVADM